MNPPDVCCVHLATAGNARPVGFSNRLYTSIDFVLWYRRRARSFLIGQHFLKGVSDWRCWPCAASRASAENCALVFSGVLLVG